MDEFITLTTTEGEDIRFTLIAEFAYDEDFYAILQPYEQTDGIAEDEALVFKIIENEDGDEYELETDEDIIDNIFEQYNSSIEE